MKEFNWMDNRWLVISIWFTVVYICLIILSGIYLGTVLMLIATAVFSAWIYFKSILKAKKDTNES